MTNNVAEVSVPVFTPAQSAVATAQPVPRNDNADATRYRLSIEAVGGNRFVYKVLDRVTGEVIRELPREEVQKLSSDPTYRGGKVIDTTA